MELTQENLEEMIEFVKHADEEEMFQKTADNPPMTYMSSDIIRFEREGGTVRDWFNKTFWLTVRQEQRREEKLLEDLNRIYTNNGSQKRSLATHIHIANPSKKLVYIDGFDDWGWRHIYPDIIDVSTNIPEPISVRMIHNASKIKTQSKFKRFASKRRK